jgi:flagella basal body P-ring formation protein FlgA
MKGDIAAMPNGIITDMAQAIGRTPTVSLPAGTPLRLDTLKSKPVVQQNQAVRMVSRGERLLGLGRRQGDRQRRRRPGGAGAHAAGAIISGTARAGGMVEVVFKTLPSCFSAASFKKAICAKVSANRRYTADPGVSAPNREG